MKPLICFAIRASLFCAAATPFVETASAEPAPILGVLALTGNATVEVKQDLLSVSFSTAREGSDANAVQAQLKQALDAALNEARKSAAPGQVEVRTGNFAIYPRYVANGGVSGWRGSAEMVAEGRDFPVIGQLTGRITTMTVARVNFSLSREASQRVEAEVVAAAIAQYRAKAASYARQFGYSMYEIREVTVTAAQPPRLPVPMMRMQAMAPTSPAEPLPVEPGQAVVEATVQGTVQLR